MSSNISIHRIVIVGTGTIGASWAAHYLAHGFDGEAFGERDGPDCPRPHRTQ